MADFARKGAAANKYYAVRHGLQPGVYRSWSDCRQQVNGFAGAVHKSFPTRAAAEAFVKGLDVKAAATSRSPGRRQGSTAGAQGHTPKRRRTLSTAPNEEADDAGAFVVRFDGGARGNPGPSGSGALVLLPGGRVVAAQCSHWLGECHTNNEAEYDALIAGLQLASQVKEARRIVVEGDSSLVINQMQGTWACEAPGLVPLHARAMSLSSGFAHVTYRHIRRELNALADALANQAMDTRSDTVVVNEDVLCKLEAGQSPAEGHPPAPPPPCPEATTALRVSVAFKDLGW